ncbi:MAG: DNA-directed RNA polymerase subunit alpha C-terminal domain-containing protein, partial [Nitrosospira sp.]
TPEQIERGITDEHVRIRLLIIRRSDCTFTGEQIERGLTDEYSHIRKAFAERNNYVPTLEQIERGLTDKESWVRKAFAERNDYMLTLEQIERGLTDGDSSIRRAFATRDDCVFTAEQIKRGFTDRDSWVREAFAEAERNWVKRSFIKGGDYTPPPILQRSIDDLLLTVRIAGCLQAKGIHYIGDLIQYNENDLLHFPNLGRKCLNETKEILSEHGLSLSAALR